MTDADIPLRAAPDRRIDGLICIALFLGTLLLYLPVRNFDFVNFDDPGYITTHELVQEGLTWEGVKWAFTGTHLSNWHPLTTLSHMAACQFFGLKAGWHHLVNVFVHAGNAALVFLVLFGMTAARWPAAAVAAALAFHPLHVESVAWISERKDVLCLTFWLLTVWTYLRWTERPGRGRYALLIASFAAGILTKPMIVTLPFALILLDVWPLGRFKPGRPAEMARQMKPLLWEKAPLFALAAFLAFMTVRAQEGDAMVEADRLPAHMRLANAVVAYAWYLFKAVWPTKLAVFYPHPGTWPAGIVATAAILIAGLTLVAVRQLRRRPFVAVGWFWFLGTLVPVIGLVQVGDQAVADRYSYIPLIGIYIAVAWLAAAFLERFEPRERRKIAGGLAGAALLASVAVSSAQIRHWRDSETLFRRALAVTEGNDIAHNNLATHLGNRGRMDEARGHLKQAYEINPHNPALLENLAKVAQLDGDIAGVTHYLSQRVAEPGADAATWFTLAGAQAGLNRLEPAIGSLEAALRLDPDLVPALNALAGIRASHPDPRFRDGSVAVKLASRAVELTGGADPALLDTLAMAHAENGAFESAVQTESKAIEVANGTGRTNLTPALLRRLELYRNSQPFRRGQ